MRLRWRVCGTHSGGDREPRGPTLAPRTSRVRCAPQDPPWPSTLAVDARVVHCIHTHDGNTTALTCRGLCRPRLPSGLASSARPPPLGLRAAREVRHARANRAVEVGALGIRLLGLVHSELVANRVRHVGPSVTTNASRLILRRVGSRYCRIAHKVVIVCRVVRRRRHRRRIR